MRRYQNFYVTANPPILHVLVVKFNDGFFIHEPYISEKQGHASDEPTTWEWGFEWESSSYEWESTRNQISWHTASGMLSMCCHCLHGQSI